MYKKSAGHKKLQQTKLWGELRRDVASFPLLLCSIPGLEGGNLSHYSLVLTYVCVLLVTSLHSLISSGLPFCLITELLLSLVSQVKVVTESVPYQKISTSPRRNCQKGQEGNLTYFFFYLDEYHILEANRS